MEGVKASARNHYLVFAKETLHSWKDLHLQMAAAKNGVQSPAPPPRLVPDPLSIDGSDGSDGSGQLRSVPLFALIPTRRVLLLEAWLLCLELAASMGALNDSMLGNTNIHKWGFP